MFRPYFNAKTAASPDPTPVNPDTRTEPTWAFHVTHTAGVTADASGVITRIDDQSSYQASTLSTSGLTLDGDPLNGLPTIRSAGGDCHARFNAIVAQDNRAELSGGLAWVMLAKTSDGNYGHTSAQQGRYGNAIRFHGLQFSNRADLLNGQGGTNAGFNTNVGTWAFRYLLIRPTDLYEVGAGTQYLTQTDSNLSDVNLAKFQADHGLMLFNEYADNFLPNADNGQLMNLAAFGVVAPDQVEQTRRYWTDLYNLSL